MHLNIKTGRGEENGKTIVIELRAQGSGQRSEGRFFFQKTLKKEIDPVNKGLSNVDPVNKGLTGLILKTKGLARQKAKGAACGLRFFWMMTTASSLQL